MGWLTVRVVMQEGYSTSMKKLQGTSARLPHLKCLFVCSAVYDKSALVACWLYARSMLQVFAFGSSSPGTKKGAAWAGMYDRIQANCIVVFGMCRINLNVRHPANLHITATSSVSFCTDISATSASRYSDLIPVQGVHGTECIA
jgi:hypothetical protein